MAFSCRNLLNNVGSDFGTKEGYKTSFKQLTFAIAVIAALSVALGVLSVYGILHTVPAKAQFYLLVVGGSVLGTYLIASFFAKCYGPARQEVATH